MTQVEISELARKAGLFGRFMYEHKDEIEVFAKLVAAKAIADLESQEKNFCPRCGKRTQDIHTCTPPQDKK
jgi:rRNA maturation endonuclease Nob1